MDDIEFDYDYIAGLSDKNKTTKKRYNNTQDLKDGKKAEIEFFSNHPEHILATTEQNKLEHWDGWTKKWGYVDVKGLGKASRGDSYK